MSAKSYSDVEAVAVILVSSDDESGTSDPEGFDSFDEEEYDNKRDPLEDGEQPTPPARPPLLPIPTPQPSSPARGTKRCRSHPPAPPPEPSPTAKGTKGRRSRPPVHEPATVSWKTHQDPDTSPPITRFQPARTPGPQLSLTSSYTPLELFTFFFPVQTVEILCHNTNKQAHKNIAQGKKYKWINLDKEEFYKYIGLLLYMAMVKMNCITDYWRRDHLFSLPLPAQVMTRDRYRTISWNLHLSDPDEDVHNDRKRGTDQHDRLFRIRPLMDTIKHACKAFYHPHRELAVGERMVSTKAETGMTQYIKGKPTKRGIKLFVLADSRNGYTVDFSVYTGKSDISSGHGLSYDVVMSLVQRAYLGTGYHIYMDNFYSSPKLFRALHACKFLACGTYRDNRQGCPRTDENALTKRSERGSIRWIRDGPIIYVKWMDTKEMSVCSTIHRAHSGETVQKMVKLRDGSWRKMSVPCPTPVQDYNRHIGGVGTSDQLIQYYSAQHKTMQWYRKLFYHFLDIATTNSYILHKEFCLAQQKPPMSHKAFMEELTGELSGRPLHTVPARAPTEHLPVPITDGNAVEADTKRCTRRRCAHCIKQGQRKDTVWKCRMCDVPLCLQVDRNCFAIWHAL